MTEPRRRPDQRVGGRSGEQAIADYLQAHPDFFNRHTHLLETLAIPHPVRGAVSLVERQVAHLREQNTRLRRKLKELIAVARDNDRLFKRFQLLTLTLLEAEDLDDMLHNLQGILRDEFHADFTALQLVAEPLAPVSHATAFVTESHLTPFKALLHHGQPLCGRLTAEQSRGLFGPSASQVASAAVVPLGYGDWQGLLGVGSQDPQRFHPTMDTQFLHRTGELISHALQPHLGPICNPRRSE
ncbi:MAG: DUF484 family protein [Candidatus Competibacterales bacterium]